MQGGAGDKRLSYCSGSSCRLSSCTVSASSVLPRPWLHYRHSRIFKSCGTDHSRQVKMGQRL